MLNNYYQPSGKASRISFVYFFISAFVILPILSWLYVYATWLNPVIYFHPLITLAFGVLVGSTLYYLVIGVGKVRNQNLAIFFGCVAGLLACYYQWAFWLEATVHPAAFGNVSQLISANLNPFVLLPRLIEIRGIQEIKLFNIHVSAWLVILIRLVEAAIIVAFPILFAIRKSREPFSESQNAWANKATLPPYEYIEIGWWLRSTLEDDDYTFLKSIKSATSDKKSHSRLTLYDFGENIYYLSITNRSVTSTDKGKIKIEDDEFIKQILIDKSSAEFLLSQEASRLLPHESRQTSWNMEPYRA